MPTRPRLPKGASIDPKEAERIVASTDPSSAAFNYWKEALGALGERVFEGIDEAGTPAMRFARALPHDRIDKLLEDRPPVLGPADDQHVLKQAGCVMATEEIAQFIRPGADTEALFQDLQAFREAAGADQPPATEASLAAAARGLIAARELYDVTRRFVWARSNAAEFDITAAECLALHRTEGAFAVTPPEASFPHGPLVRTGSSGCRTSRVFHSLNINSHPQRVERPGFALVMPIKEYFRHFKLKENLSERSQVHVMIKTNLLVTGGLDLVVAWTAERFDELRVLVRHAFEKPGVPASRQAHRQAFREKLRLPAGNEGLTQAEIDDLVYRLLANIIMTLIEFADELPNANELIDRGLEEVSALLDTHRVQARPRGARTDVHLLGDSRGVDTLMCLRTQCRWYAASKKPTTLLARRDRTGAVARIDAFSPFMAYLRFHSGDERFVPILLRTLRRLPALYKRAKQGMGRRTGRWGRDFAAALEAAEWRGLTADEKNQLKQDIDYWRRNVKDARHRAVKPMWRHRGLLAALRRRPGAPLWPGAAPTPDVYWETRDRQAYETLDEAAAIVKRNLTLIEDRGLLPALSSALETIPIDKLIDAGVLAKGSRSILAKAHNFERLRLVYQKAWDAATKS